MGDSNCDCDGDEGDVSCAGESGGEDALDGDADCEGGVAGADLEQVAAGGALAPSVSSSAASTAVRRGESGVDGALSASGGRPALARALALSLAARRRSRAPAL